MLELEGASQIYSGLSKRPILEQQSLSWWRKVSPFPTQCSSHYNTLPPVISTSVISQPPYLLLSLLLLLPWKIETKPRNLIALDSSHKLTLQIKLVTKSCEFCLVFQVFFSILFPNWSSLFFFFLLQSLLKLLCASELLGMHIKDASPT